MPPTPTGARRGGRYQIHPMAGQPDAPPEDATLGGERPVEPAVDGERGPAEEVATTPGAAETGTAAEDSGEGLGLGRATGGSAHAQEITIRDEEGEKVVGSGSGSFPPAGTGGSETSLSTATPEADGEGMSRSLSEGSVPRSGVGLGEGLQGSVYDDDYDEEAGKPGEEVDELDESGPIVVNPQVSICEKAKIVVVWACVR
jgi:hypothetical protein